MTETRRPGDARLRAREQSRPFVTRIACGSLCGALQDFRQRQQSLRVYRALGRSGAFFQ